MKITYEYIKPKTPAEQAEAERSLQAAYSILFDMVLDSPEWKEYMAKKRKKA